MTSAARALLAAGLAVMSANGAAQDPVPIEQEPRHRLAFENTRIRFFDVQLPPGYRSMVHIHHHDGVFVNISPAETEAEDWGKPPVRRAPRTPGESYFIGYAKTPKAHRVSNVGSTEYRVTDTEILQGCGERAPDDTARSGPVLVDNKRVRVTRIELAPGASTPLHGPCGMLVLVTSGTARFDGPGGVETVAFAPAGFKWRDGTLPVAMKNVGNEPLHAVDILVK